MKAFIYLQRVGATLHRSAQASHCGGFSCGGTQAVGHTTFSTAPWLYSTGSVVVEHRLSSGGAQAQLLHGIRGLPGSGIEPVSPAPTGGHLITEPPGKTLIKF